MSVINEIGNCLPTDLAEVPAWLRARCDEHASVYDIVVYGRPETWLAIAEVLSCASGIIEALTPAPGNAAGGEGHVERLIVALTREARDNLYSGEELAAIAKLGDEICDYIERCRTNLKLDGAIRTGVDHILRHQALPMLAQRPKCILQSFERATPPRAQSTGAGVEEPVCPVCHGYKEIGDGHGAAACVACAAPRHTTPDKDFRTPEAKKWSDEFIPPRTCGSIDDIQNDIEHLRDANSQLRHSAYYWKRRCAALAAMPARRECIENVPCRFGCKAATGIYYVPKGCSCWNDPVQALCEQHAIKAQSEGPITLIARVGR